MIMAIPAAASEVAASAGRLLTLHIRQNHHDSGT
jgi:hypothetical protein